MVFIVGDKNCLTRGPVCQAALPGDAVVFPVVRAPSPERAVFSIEKDGVDGARGVSLEIQLIAHLDELFPDPLRHLVVQVYAAGEEIMFAERAPHLIARDVGGLAGLLDVHAELTIVALCSGAVFLERNPRLCGRTGQYMISLDQPYLSMSRLKR